MLFTEDLKNGSDLYYKLVDDSKYSLSHYDRSMFINVTELVFNKQYLKNITVSIT